MTNEEKRFAFGKNWSRFLKTLTPERIEEAEKSLASMLEVDSMAGKTFLDIGSGSGLFSLAARRMGAEVFSFDYDADSVACTDELKRQYFPDDPQWQITQGSVLDEEFMNAVPKADIVYSWGVLHHSGSMWKALEATGQKVRPGGRLFIAIYNDQGFKSRIWLKLKQVYCSGLPGRWAVTFAGSAYFAGICLKEDLLRFRNPCRRYIDYKKNRGMSIWHDWVDWFGGYPFEVAKPDVLFDFYRQRGFELTKLVTVGGNLACNELVFRLVE